MNAHASDFIGQRVYWPRRLDRSSGAPARIGHLDRRAIASLAGLAQKARESGKFRGKRRIGQERCAIRTLLYMAALSLWRTKGDKTNSATLRRMTAEGKAEKIILILLVRKIVTMANAVLRDQAPFRVTPQS